MPFQGRGSLPANQSSIDVYVSAFVDQLLEVCSLRVKFCTSGRLW